MRAAVLLAALALAGCGTTGVNSALNNPSCVVKLSGKVAFGSITPTGEARWSATCKPGTAGEVKPADVAQPPNVP